MKRLKIFKGHRYCDELILLCVRWYCTYPISYRNLSDIIEELGIKVNYSNLNRWVHKFAPKIYKKIKPHIKKTSDSWRVDEVKLKIKNEWHWLFRATDSKGKSLGFMISQRRNKAAVKRFFKLLLKNNNGVSPRVINVDGLTSYPPALKELQSKQIFSKKTILRCCKYLNNILESDHRFIKKIYKTGLSFKCIESTKNTISGIEAIHMLNKGQIKNVNTVLDIKKYVNRIFKLKTVGNLIFA